MRLATNTVPSFPEPNRSAISSWRRAAYDWAFTIKPSFMIAEQYQGAHSAQVEMRLIVNGDTISITHMGSDYLLVNCAKDYPPGEACIYLQVDQSESRWQVILPNGISKNSKRVALASCE